MLLSGKGHIWMDNASFQEVDENVPVTDFEIAEAYPNHPENLLFEE